MGSPVTGDVIGSYFEPLSGRCFMVAEPAAQPVLWRAYLEGARQSYRQHGVEDALDYADVRDGRTTALFAVATDDAGCVVGGLRVRGPFSQVGQVHAVREWAGRPGTSQIRHQVAQRLPSGVIEIKAVWVQPDIDRRAALTAALARAFVHAQDLLGARYALCTAATHAVPRWRDSGGEVSTDVAAVAYPDERYRTQLMWWDRNRVAEVMPSDQHAALTRESVLLRGVLTAPSTLQSVA